MSTERRLAPTGEGADRFIEEWLLQGADSMNRGRMEWQTQGVALVRCGRSFAAVRIPARLVHAAAGSDDLETVRAALERHLSGPVIHDGQSVSGYYVLIQWHTGLVWDGEDDTPCLGDDTFMGVPQLGRRYPPGTYWVVAPRRDGDLCRPALVRSFIERARQRLAAAEASS